MVDAMTQNMESKKHMVQVLSVVDGSVGPQLPFPVISVTLPGPKKKEGRVRHLRIIIVLNHFESL